jgi:hypothetical protein
MAIFIPYGHSNAGEHQLHEDLQKRLPTDWYIVGNPVVKPGPRVRRSPKEIDAAVISDRTVFLIDQKTVGQPVLSGTENGWVGYGERNSPIDDMLEWATWFRGRVRSADPGLGDRLWVNGIVVLTGVGHGKDFRIDVQDRRMDELVCRAHEAPGLLIERSVRSSTFLRPSEQRLIASLLIHPEQLARYFPEGLANNAPTVPAVPYSPAAVRRPPRYRITIMSTSVEGFRSTFYSDDGDVDMNVRRLRGATQEIGTLREIMEGRNVAIQFAADGPRVSVRKGNVTLNGRNIVAPDVASLPPAISSLDLNDVRLLVQVEEMNAI